MRLLLGLLLLYEALFFTIDYVLISDDLVFSALGDQLSYERINDIIDSDKKFRWLSYLLLPIFLLLKFFMVGFSLSLLGIMTGIENSFIQFFKSVVVAEFVFVLPFLLKVLWFGFIQTDYSLSDIQYFSPLSIFGLFQPEEVQSWLIYPLQLLNLFELAYWCILAWQLKDLLNRDFAGSLGFVASTYGVGLLLWVIFVMFLTVSLT